jgi:hypothetical protein
MDSWGLYCRVVAEVEYNGCAVVMADGKSGSLAGVVG